MEGLNNADRIRIVEAIEGYIVVLREDQRTWGTGEEDKDMGMFFDLKINDYIEIITKIK
jgi:hypothetical protein